MIHRTSILVCVIFCIASGARAQVYRFDLGSATSELRDGFTGITAKSIYDAKIGYGWREAGGMKEHVQPVAREFRRDEHSGRDVPPPIYANELTCDSILGTKPNAFLIDLAPGDYTIYLLCGRSSGGPTEYHFFEVSAGSAKQTVKIPGPYRFEKCILRTSIPGRQLAIELAPKTDWTVAAIIVYPTREEAQVRASFLDALEKEIDFLPPEVAAKWKETKHVDDRAQPQYTQADRDRGYALFARHWSEPIYPNTVPRQGELDPGLAIFASLGEYEPATFTIAPFRDLHGVKVISSDLTCDGAAIPAANIDVRYVRYMLVRPNYSTFYAYHVAPDVLEHKDAVDLAKGENKTLWLTLKVPDSAKPGVYRGHITVQAADAPPAKLPLSVRVLPIRLQKNPEHIYGLYYHDPLRKLSDRNTPEANAYLLRKAQLERQDMAEHGFNNHTSDAAGLTRQDDGTWILKPEQLEQRIDMDRRYGLADKPLVMSFSGEWWYSKLVDKKGTGSHLRLVRPDVPQSYFDEVTKMVAAIEAERKKHNWPEFLYYPVDEPSTHENAVKFMANILKAVKQVPGVRSYVTADPSEDNFGPMWPYVDVWCCQPFVFDHDRIQRLSREKKIEFWCYPNHISGENDHTPVRGARMTFGFGFWKSGFKTLIPWIYAADVGDPWNYLDGSSMDFGNRSTPDGEPIPVMLWEAFREGIDDGRYIYTLQQLALQAKQKGGRAADLAATADKELQFVWNAFVPQEKYKYDGLWSGKDFDAYRWLLASKILELQAALK